MNLPEFLSRDGDFIHVTGHRIGLQDLVFYYNEGITAEGLLDAFPTLDLSVIHRTIAFYLDNKADVDAYLAGCEAEMAQQRAAAPRGPDAAELRRRLSSRQTADS